MSYLDSLVDVGVSFFLVVSVLFDVASWLNIFLDVFY